MNRYYAGSTPFRWLRKKLGVKKPTALGWGEWAKWENNLKAERPIAHFLTETLPDWCELPGKLFYDPIDNARYRFLNRFVDQTHVLNTGLKKGEYHPMETRILYGLFNELVDFVEVDMAWKHFWCLDDRGREKYNVPAWYRLRFLRWNRWRCADAGLDYLNWEAELGEESPRQAEKAKETLRLYNWWKTMRPDRPEDSWEPTGFRAFWHEMDAKYGDDNWLLGPNKKMTKAEEATYKRLSKATDDLEQSWYDEDTRMLHRIINLRTDLNT